MQKIGTKFQKVLCNVWVDKVVALILVSYSVYMTLEIIGEKRGLPLVLLLARVVILNGLTLVRRAPNRITVSPFFWLIAIAEAYFELFYGVFRAYPGTALCPQWLTDGLSMAALFILILARISLWRSFGIVAADRGIVTKGLYGIVRHPIYTVVFIAVTAYVLSNFSVVTLTLAAINFALTITKALMEERFLSANETYRLYMQRVRYRFIPSVA